MTERDSLDAIAIQVPSNRSRKDLLPRIHDHCLPGSIFCSDGWKAYYELAEHLDVDDALHYAVNHSENFVDPETVHIHKQWKVSGVNVNLICLILD